MKVMFAVNMTDPDNEGRPTVDGRMLGDTSDQDKRLLRVVTMHNQPSVIELFGPDGEVLLDLSKMTDRADDSEVDKPMNLAWTGDENSDFMEHVKGPLMDVAKRVAAANIVAKTLGLDPNEVFLQMAQEIEGAVSTSEEEVRQAVDKAENGNTH